MNKFWFKPKKFGYGATPATWEGWTFTAGYALFVLVISLIFMGREPAVRDVIAWIALLIPATIGTVWVSWRKTDGEWRWRWSRNNSRKAS
jgi:hypothetical protein